MLLHVLVATLVTAAPHGASPAPAQARASSGLLTLVTGGDSALTFTLDSSSLTYTVTTAADDVAFTSHGAEGRGFAYSAGGKTYTLADPADGLVRLGGPYNASGRDATGSYAGVGVNFTRRSSGKVEWIATVKAYMDRPALVFAQT